MDNNKSSRDTSSQGANKSAGGTRVNPPSAVSNNNNTSVRNNNNNHSAVPDHMATVMTQSMAHINISPSGRAGEPIQVPVGNLATSITLATDAALATHLVNEGSSSPAPSASSKRTHDGSHDGLFKKPNVNDFASVDIDESQFFSPSSPPLQRSLDLSQAHKVNLDLPDEELLALRDYTLILFKVLAAHCTLPHAVEETTRLNIKYKDLVCQDKANEIHVHFAHNQKEEYERALRLTYKIGTLYSHPDFDARLDYDKFFRLMASVATKNFKNQPLDIAKGFAGIGVRVVNSADSRKVGFLLIYVRTSYDLDRMYNYCRVRGCTLSIKSEGDKVTLLQLHPHLFTTSDEQYHKLELGNLSLGVQSAVVFTRIRALVAEETAYDPENVISFNRFVVPSTNKPTPFGFLMVKGLHLSEWVLSLHNTITFGSQLTSVKRVYYAKQREEN